MANNNHFELTLDTLAPTGSISRGDHQYAKENFALTIDIGDATFMYVWVDKVETPTEIPGTCTVEAANTTKNTNFPENGTFYYHLVLEDAVGNRSAIYSTASIIYDTVAPTVNSVNMIPRAYVANVAYVVGQYLRNDGTFYRVKEAITAAENTSFDAISAKLEVKSTFEVTTKREVSINFTATDATPSSAIVSCAISGDINADATAWSTTLTTEEIAALATTGVTRNIVLSGTGEEEATKTVNITVTDNAGNVATAVSDSIVLDTQMLTGSIVVRDAADTKTLNDNWVNFQDIKVKLTLGSTATDVVGYKIWGDINADGSATATTEPANFITVATGTNPIYAQIFVSSVDYAINTAYAKDAVVKYNYKLYKANADITAGENTGWDAISSKMTEMGVKLTSGDAAAKTINAKVVDDAGNEVTLTAVIVKADYSDPTVSIALESGATKFVSNVSGFNTKVLVPTFDGSISGIASYVWKKDGEAHTGGTGTGDPTNFTVNASDLGGTDGDKAFTLTVTDNAGNTTTSSVVDIYLDTTAPTGSISMNAWYGGDAVDEDAGFHKFNTAGATASATDGGSSVAYMTCWCSQVAEDTTVAGTQIAYHANPTHANINWTSHAESATNYIHIQYVDAVGNTAIVHSAAFGIDTVVPPKGTVTFTKDVYASTAAQVKFTYEDATSGVEKYLISGDRTAPTDWQAVTGTSSNYDVTLTTPDGTKSVQVKFRDVAGNVSELSDADTTELDTTVPGALLELRKKDDSAVQPTVVNASEFAAHVAGMDDKVAYAYNATKAYAAKKPFLAGENISNADKYYVVNTAFTADQNTSFDAISDRLTEVTGNKYAVGAYVVNLAEHNHKLYKVTAAVTYAENTSFTAIASKLEEQTGDVSAAVKYKLYGDFVYATTYATATAYAAKDIVVKDSTLYVAKEAITADENTGWDAVSAKFEAFAEGKQPTQGITEANATWKQLVYVSGQVYMLVPTSSGESANRMFCTAEEGAKAIYLKVQDNAENVSEAAMQSFFYDRTAPEVTVGAPDHNNISKVHSKRLQNTSGTITELTTYNDETKFTFTPNTVIQAYKVVAYVSQEAAKAGSYADEPIKQTGDEATGGVTPASTNMHATGLSSDAAVNATIKGADYEQRLMTAYDSNAMTQAEAEAAGFTFEDGEVNGIDGAHYVVVYVQDLGGT